MSLILLGILNSQAAAAGGAGAYDLLETQVLTSDTASVTFTGLGSYSDYKHLQIRIVGRSSINNTNNPVDIYFNSDNTGGDYASHFMTTYQGNVNSEARTSQNVIQEAVYLPANNAPTSNFGAAVVDILDFSSSNKNTTIRSLNAYEGVDANNRGILLGSGFYNSTAAITSITFEGYNASGNFKQNSRFSLYGAA